ncbi:chondroitinase-B domain-containing protein [Bacteroidota bacterium]
MKRLSIFLSTMICISGFWGNLNAKTWLVSSGNSFSSAHYSAATGDTIAWTEGVFNDINMGISKNNLHVLARTPGRTIFTGNSRVSISGSDNTFSGFQYLEGNCGNNYVVQVTGSRNHLTQLNIKNYYCQKYLVIKEGCSHNILSYCNLEHKTYLGDKNVLSILVEDNAPGYHTIRYCSFKNFDGTGGDMGIEPIRIGLSTQGEFISRSTIEYCYFTQCNGDGEIISNKARQNVFRYNTFYDNPKAELVLRHGDQGVVYGNFFLKGMGGVRVKEGQNHVIFNNYFSGLTSRSINLQNYYVDPLDSITIAYNTIVKSAKVDLGGSGSYPPQNVTFANNIFTDPTAGLFTNTTGTETWMGNISHGTLGITRPEGIIATDPMLVPNTEGYYGLSAGSPAIDSAKSGYPSLPNYPGMEIDHDVLLDLMKQTRPGPISDKDIGCSEYPLDSLIRPHVSEYNTGPQYLWEGGLVYLSVNSGSGSIILDPPGWMYEPGTKVVLTAVPPLHNTFLEWGGDLTGNDNPDTLVMNSNKNVTAYFESISNQIQLNKLGGDILQIFPNPASDIVSVLLNIDHTALIELALYDLTGKQVMSIYSGRLGPGDYKYEADLRNLRPGLYLLGLKRSNNSTIMIRIQKI